MKRVLIASIAALAIAAPAGAATSVNPFDCRPAPGVDCVVEPIVPGPNTAEPAVFISHTAPVVKKRCTKKQKRTLRRCKKHKRA